MAAGSRGCWAAGLHADEDPDDRYYNEWLLLSEFLSSIPGVLAYDPMLGEWLGQSASGSR